MLALEDETDPGLPETSDATEIQISEKKARSVSLKTKQELLLMDKSGIEGGRRARK